jgi:hypothetical protein
MAVAISTGSSSALSLGESFPAVVNELIDPYPITKLLYPHIFIDAVTAGNGPNLLPSGNLALVQIDMTVTQMTRIIVTQVSLTQDFGMRFWLSVKPLGSSIISTWPRELAVSRMTPEALFIYTFGQTPDSGSLAQIAPGLYYLNILNLTNCPSVFMFSKTDLA